MSNPPFKQMEVCDVFAPERVMMFERPREDHETIIIRTERTGDFHLDAGTLRVIAEVLALSPSAKEIRFHKPQ